MFHCNGWGMPYARHGDGRASRWCCARSTARTSCAASRAEGVTLLCGAPAVVAAILDAAAQRRDAGRRGARAGDSVRMVVAGAPPPSKTIERVETELGLGVHPDLRPHRDVAAAHHEPGAPPSGTGSIAGGAGRAACRVPACPAIGVRMDVDAEGEVLARSNNVFEGYWEQPEETAKAIVDGWFHTGDGGYLDGRLRRHRRPQEGRDHHAAARTCRRSRSRTASTSTRPWPRCAVIGVPDEKWGETVKALVVLRRGRRRPPRPSSSSHCRDRMAHFKCPTSVELRDALRPHRHRQAPEVQAPPALLGRPRPPGQLAAAPGDASVSTNPPLRWFSAHRSESWDPAVVPATGTHCSHAIRPVCSDPAVGRMAQSKVHQ